MKKTDQAQILKEILNKVPAKKDGTHSDFDCDFILNELEKKGISYSPFQYFVTVISAYEEVYKEKVINLKKMESEIKKLDKIKNLTPFLKKIRRRQIISEFTSQKEDVYNPYEQQRGYRKSRTMMYFHSLEKAIKAIKTNSCDLLESGSWGTPTFVLIEKYHEGFCLNDERWFFEVSFDKNRKFKVKKIKEPIWARGSVNYAF